MNVTLGAAVCPSVCNVFIILAYTVDIKCFGWSKILRQVEYSVACRRHSPCVTGSLKQTSERGTPVSIWFKQVLTGSQNEVRVV